MNNILPFEKRKTAINKSVNTFVEKEIILYATTGDIQIPRKEQATFQNKWQAEEYALQYVKSHAQEIAKKMVREYYHDENPFGGLIA